MNLDQVIASWSGSLSMAWQVIFTKIVLFLPSFLAGVVVFWLGVIIANWCYHLTKKLVILSRLEKAVDDSGLGQFLQRAEVTTKVEEVIAQAVKWLILAVVLITTLNILGLSGVSALLERVLSFIPRVLSAAVVLAIGLVLAGLVESVIKGAIIPFDIKLGRLVAKISSYLVAVLSVMAALQELGIAQDLIRAIYAGFILSFALAVGLSFGLGSKDIVQEIVTSWYHSLSKRSRRTRTTRRRRS